jgi:ATP/maltotriose-dependent transcriptional regulator MalT
MPADQELRGLPLAFMAAAYIWDDDELEAVSARFARVYRDAGALSDLALALNARALVLLLVGDLAWATTLIDEAQVVMEATEIEILPCAALGLAALRGDEADALARINAGIRDGWRRGEGSSLSAAEWASAVLGNGLGRYEQVLGVAQRASEDRSVPPFSNWALAEVVEAATRTGKGEAAAEAASRLADIARVTRTNWAQGIEARSRALISHGEVAESLYREAIDRLGLTRVRLELARAHLLYGEWLRRERRRLDAREQLRAAREMFTAMGVEAFAARAERELLATGERVRSRSIETTDALTAQEAQIARLARDGLSNTEIGARLFISQHTVAYHLRKVFSKLDITSRNQLAQVLPESASAGQVA